VANLHYRDDVGEYWIDDDGDRLQAWGYLGDPLTVSAG
jgi:phosphoribosylamine--glycine ligase